MYLAQNIGSSEEQQQLFPTLTSQAQTQLIEPPYLQKLGIVYNCALPALICLGCGIALVPSHIVEHIKNKHPDCGIVLSRDSIEQDIKQLAIKDQFPSLDFIPRPAIQGLPVHTALQCGSCSKVYVAQSSILKHHHMEHKNIPMPSSWATVAAQQLNNSNQRTYFPVIPALSTHTSHAQEIVNQLQAAMQTLDGQPTGHRLDPRLVSPWLKSNRWLELIKDKPIDELRASVAPLKKDEFSLLVAAVQKLYFGSEDMFDLVPELVLQRLNTPDPVKTGISNQPFHRHQDHQLRMKEYTSPVIYLLAMLLRKPACMTFQLPLHVAQCLASLESALVKPDSVPLSMHVLRLLIALWTHPFVSTKNQLFPDPTIVCLALMMLEPDGRFKHPKHTTGPIARFEYCMRNAFMIEIYRKVKNNQATTYLLEMDAIAPWITEKYDSTFNSLRSLQHRATAIAESTMALPQIWWLDRQSFQTMLFKGTPISFADIKKLFIQIEEDLVQKWEQDIMCGLKLQCSYSNITDDLTNTAVGYSFISDQHNPFTSMKSNLVLAILDDPVLRKRFISWEQDGHIIWNKLALRSWLYCYSQFEGLLLIRGQMLGGAPGRGTELTAMTFQNIPTSTHRNCIAFGKYLAMLVTYHKGTALTGSHKLIPHAFDGVTSDLIIQNLALARPFAQMAAHICHDDSAEVRQIYRDQLFVNNGKLFTSTDVTHIMNDYTENALGIKLGLRSWRQVSIAFKRKMCSALDDLIDVEDQDTIEAQQAAHSRRTENRIYGLSADALSGVAEDVLPLYLDASTDWQVASHTVPGGLGLSYQECRSIHFDKLVEAKKISLRGSTNTSSAEGSTKVLVQAVTEALQPVIQESIQQACTTLKTHLETKIQSAFESLQDLLPKILSDTKVNTLKQSVDEEFEEISSPEQAASSSQAWLTSPDNPTNNQSRIETQNWKIQALKGLRLALKKPHATWSCLEQQQAVVATLECKADVCAFLRTGAGKTMLAIIPTFIEKGQATVVILPLKSLVSDYKRKLSQMDIPFEHYTGAEDEVITGKRGLILVSADKARTSGWRQTIGQVHQMRPVKRFVFDEGQLALTSDDFRASLQNLEDIRSIPVQLVILSATIPPASEKALVKAFGLTPNCKMIRMSTDRPELEYILKPASPSHQATCSTVLEVLEEEMQTFSEQDRALVFVSLKEEEGHAIAARLGCDFYEGGKTITDHEREAMYYRWIEGVHKVMICTNAFGAGNDYPHVRLVIHAGTPKQMINFVQEVGRAGRDGQRARCIVVPRSKSGMTEYTKRPLDDIDHRGYKAIWTMLYQSTMCLRFSMTAFTDHRGVACGTTTDSVKCSRCLAQTAWTTSKTPATLKTIPATE
ncbi:hypothetical protein C0992_012212 [Termitomyces sp. T32_za158]|nr:hypothetical protein C0992_012212 [Termitomyces sp. T32_za158]